jgi:hypothetical protein
MTLQKETLGVPGGAKPEQHIKRGVGDLKVTSIITQAGESSIYGSTICPPTYQGQTCGRGC